MADIIERHNPSSILFPVNNRNTAWRPVALPVILVVPHRRDKLGTPRQYSGVFNVRIYIEDVPHEALVAGHDHIGQRFPDREIYSENIDSIELADAQISLNGLLITRDGVEVDILEAEEGDLVHYTTSTGVIDTFQFLPDADYYDLSAFPIDIETLIPDRYNIVYQAEFYMRVISADGSNELLCIDINHTAIARTKFLINHPGDVIHAAYKLTPPPYLSSSQKSTDTTVALYRPFTDILQDIMDEQDLLERVNWVFETPPEIIPYLSSLLGWDIPYFPESLDSLRKAVLRRTVEFQQLKGSRRAIINLFRLFGFEILITNLWWSSDGKRFIRPGQRLPEPYTDEEIIIADVCQVDTLLSSWDTDGFGEFDIPLLFRPQVITGDGDFEAVRDGGDITIESYLVENDSAAYDALSSIAAAVHLDPEGYGEAYGCTTNVQGFRTSLGISESVDGLEVLGFSQILITGSLGQATDEIAAGGEIPVRRQNVSFDRSTNQLHVTLNGYFDMTNKSIFSFAIYGRQKIVVPDVLANLQSNRFDIQVLSQNLTEFADPVTLEFALEFLERLKAFHSLLNVVRTRAELTETYEVTDWCVGGNVLQRYDTDAGRLQVPPAIIPNIPDDINDCTRLDPASLGYKDADIELRLRKLANLPEEHDAWKILDERILGELAGLRVAPLQPVDRESCTYTPYGQDRVTGEREETVSTQFNPAPTANTNVAGGPLNPRPSPNDVSEAGEFDTTGPNVSSNSNSEQYSSFTREHAVVRIAHCTLDGNDYCYKGRVDDELLYRQGVPLAEWPRLKACSLGLGVGVYYTFPAYSKMVVEGVSRPSLGSSTPKSEFSGKAPAGNIKYLDQSPLSSYLLVDRDTPLPKDSDLSRLYRAYGSPEDETLHYHNRLDSADPSQWHNLALQRPSLGIEKASLHLPGCRFPFMNQLEDDFIHPEWMARPWDDPYSTYCATTCTGQAPTFLNAELIVGTDGNERLTFDSITYQIASNGLIADIPSLGDHTLGGDANFETSDVVHSVYTSADESQYVVLDQTCYYGTEIVNGIMEVADPLFQSHQTCDSSTLDFADGYACVSGQQTYSGEDFDWAEVLDGLDMPAEIVSPVQVLFLLGSGIRSESGVRLDCGCLLVDCDVTASGESICSADLFIDQDGDYDWNHDHIQLDIRLLSEETVGMCSLRLDGSIPTLLELLTA